MEVHHETTAVELSTAAQTTAGRRLAGGDRRLDAYRRGRRGGQPGRGTTGGTVLQTNLVSDLPGVAAVQDPNLVNAWGISESASSPFWISDNNAGVSTLYSAAGVEPAVSRSPHWSCTFQPQSTRRAVAHPPGRCSTRLAAAAPSRSPARAGGGNPTTLRPRSCSTPKTAPSPAGTRTSSEFGQAHAVIAVDNSGNNFTNPDPNQQTGAVYKGLAIATSSTPIISGDPNSTALLYATNFRAGTIEVYDAAFTKVTAAVNRRVHRPRAACTATPRSTSRSSTEGLRHLRPAGRQPNTTTLAGPHRGFVDVFNLNGSPALPGRAVRLISRGPLDSPWGLAIAPQGFAGLSAPHNDPVLLVGNFGDGLINAFDATNGSPLGQLKDPDGEPIQIDGLWALQVGNGGAGGNRTRCTSPRARSASRMACSAR